MKRRFHLLSSLVATLLLAGCMGYQLGGTRPKGIETVYVAPVVNATAEPAIELQVTRALRQRIQFDGRLKLRNSPDNSDAVIEVKLTDYKLRAIAFRDDLKTTPEQYRLRITGIATLKNAETGETLSESKTYGEARFLFESDLTTSKRNALPRAAEEIAKFMVDDLIERWN
ncbi:MAG: LPS assembly lipoprotein LptE [Verrucomicrobiota bacterium]